MCGLTPFIKASYISLFLFFIFSHLSYCDSEDRNLFLIEKNGWRFEIGITLTTARAESKTDTQRQYLSVMIWKKELIYREERSVGKVFGILVEGLATSEEGDYKVSESIKMRFLGPNQDVIIIFKDDYGRDFSFALSAKEAIGLRDKIAKFYSDIRKENNSDSNK